jgi:hypothetical protein
MSKPMSNQLDPLRFKRRRGDLEVWVDEDGEVTIEWKWGSGYMGEEGRVYLTTDEFNAILGARERYAETADD